MSLQVNFMKVEMVRIVHSRGIRILNPVVDQCGLGDTVKLRVDNKHLVISARRRTREGWADAFRAAGPMELDKVFLGDAGQNRFDREDWRW